MKKGQQITLKIEENIFPNIGVGYVDGKKVRVKNTLVGQTVLCRVTKSRSGKIEAKWLEKIEPAPWEQASFCEHYNRCGGCLLQTLSLDKQLEHKKEMVENLLKDAGHDISPEAVYASPKPFEYRNKMEFSFGDEFKDGPMTLGMHKKGRHHDVVTVDACHLCDGDFRTILKAVLAYAQEKMWPKYNKKTHEGFLRHLVVRKAENTGEIMVALSASTQFEWEVTPFVGHLKALDLSGEIKSILWVKNDGLGDLVTGEVVCLEGEHYITEKMLGLTFQISLYSFFQPNTQAASLLYEKALSFIEGIEGKVCFDLFSGTGTIAQLMAKKAKHVIGIEIVEDAVEMAKMNAELNNLEHCEFLCGDVFDVLETVTTAPDVIVVDPPRVGIREKTVSKIASYGVPEILYISCNPKTLAEDLLYFKNKGYHVKRFVLVDQFTWTGNIEAICLLSR